MITDGPRRAEPLSLGGTRRAIMGLFRRSATPSEVERLASVLIDEPAYSPDEIFRRCQALESLSALGPPARAALPAMLRTLMVDVTVDCVLALRVAAGQVAWRVSHRLDVAVRFLAWAPRTSTGALFFGPSRSCRKSVTPRSSRTWCGLRSVDTLSAHLPSRCIRGATLCGTRNHYWPPLPALSGDVLGTEEMRPRMRLRRVLRSRNRPPPKSSASAPHPRT
jgi:hypothetical protein